MPELNSTLIKEIRQAEGLTQDALLEKCDIDSKRTIQRAEQGKTVTLTVYREIASKLRLDPPSLLLASSGIEFKDLLRDPTGIYGLRQIQIETEVEMSDMNYSKVETSESDFSAVATESGSSTIELTIDRDFDTYSENDQARLLGAIGRLLEVADISVRRKSRGSVKLELELTPDQAERLYWAVKQGLLEELDVTDAEITETIIWPDATTHATEIVQDRELEVLAPNWISRSLMTSLPLLCVDLITLIVCLSCSLLLVSTIFQQTLAAHQIPDFFLALTGCYAMMGLRLGLFPATGMNPVVELRRQVSTAVVSHIFLLTLSGAFGKTANFEFVAVILSGVTAAVLMPLARSFARLVCSRFSWWGEPVMLVGSSPMTDAIYEYLLNCPQQGLRPIGIVGESNLTQDERLGDLSNLKRLVKEHRVEWVIANLNHSSQSEQQEILAACTGLRHLIILHNQIVMPSLWSHSHECAGLSGTHIQDQLLSKRSLFIKRLIDVSIIALSAPLIIPMMIVLVCLIKFRSPGAAFYGHTLIGRNNKPFKAWKLRTMVQNTDKVLEQYLKAHPESRYEWERDQILKEDPRIIPGIGSVLRKVGLDELPQLWNVLVGEMSLVGPRAIVQAEVSNYQDAMCLYLRVKPGITGLWQISGGNNTSYEDRIRLDSFYVRNWSLWLDYFILLKTLRIILRREVR